MTVTTADARIEATTTPGPGRRSPVARPLRAVGRAEGVPSRPPAPIPRTSTARPWDRLQFAAQSTRVTLDQDDAAADLAPVIPIIPPLPSEDPAQWSGSYVRAAVEALAGTRPAPQLARWSTAELYESLSRRAGLAVRISGRPAVVRQAVVRRVRLCRLSDTTVEAAVVVHDGERVRCAAVRVEAYRGRWRATALQIG